MWRRRGGGLDFTDWMFILDRKCYRKVCTKLIYFLFYCGVGDCKGNTRDVDGSCTNYVLVLKALAAPRCCDTQLKLFFPLVTKSRFFEEEGMNLQNEYEREFCCLCIFLARLPLGRGWAGSVVTLNLHTDCI